MYWSSITSFWNRGTLSLTQNKCTELDLAATLHGRFPSSDSQRSWFSTNQRHTILNLCGVSISSHLKHLTHATCSIPRAISFLNCKPWNSMRKASSAWQLFFSVFLVGGHDWANYISKTCSQEGFKLLYFIYWTHSQLTSLSREASRCSLLGLIMNSLLTSTDGCSPCLLGAYIIFLIARRTEFLLHHLKNYCFTL